MICEGGIEVCDDENENGHSFQVWPATPLDLDIDRDHEIGAPTEEAAVIFQFGKKTLKIGASTGRELVKFLIENLDLMKAPEGDCD